MNKIILIISLISLSCFVVNLICNVSVNAQSIGAKLNLEGSTKLKENNLYTYDISIDSPVGQKLSSVRVALKFDINYLEIREVKLYNLFCNYPTDKDSYLLDNTNEGYLIVTGISSGTQSCPFYEGNGSKSKFLSIKALAKKKGRTSIGFLYDGTNTSKDVSYVMDNNSPPLMVLKEPSGKSLFIGSASDHNISDIPDTAVTPTLMVGFSVILFVVGLMIRKSNRKNNLIRYRYEY